MRFRSAASTQISSPGQRRAAGISAGQEDAGFGQFFRGELPKKIGVLLVGRWTAAATSNHFSISILQWSQPAAPVGHSISSHSA